MKEIKEQTCWVYVTTNLINGKQYIGMSHFKNKYYLGSGKLIKSAVNKYGKENFMCIKLQKYELRDCAHEAEAYWIKGYNTLVPNGYNIDPGGGTKRSKIRIGYKLSAETKRKISETKKHRFNNMTTIEKAELFKKHKGRIPWNKGKKGCQVAWNKDKKTGCGQNNPMSATNIAKRKAKKNLVISSIILSLQNKSKNTDI